MKTNGKARGIGVAIGVTTLAAIGLLRLGQSGMPGGSVFQNGETIYTGKSVAKLAGLTATETFINVPNNWETVVAKVKREIPIAIERRDEDGPYLVVPQTRHGRVMISEFPEQSITVRPGRLTRVGARMMVRADSGTDWAHVQIQDFRQPSALESAFNWLGDRLGI